MARGFTHDAVCTDVPGLDATNLGDSRPLTDTNIRRVVGPVSSDYDIVFYTNSRNNLMRGLVNRVLTYKGGPVLEPSPGAWKSLRGLATSLGNRCLTTPLSPDEFLACYVGRKRTIYAKAIESFKTRPWDARKDMIVKAFIKKEKDKLVDESCDPRIIQPRTPRFVTRFGRYVRAIEKRLYSEWTKSFSSFTVTNTPVCLKGMNYRTRARALLEKWQSFDSPVAVCLDASRFDLHVSVDALKFTDQIYLSAFTGIDRSELKEILKNRHKTTGFATCKEGTFHYEKVGGRCSGDSDTSLGNVSIMLAITRVICEGLKGIHIEVANDGDDQVLMVETNQLDNLVKELSPTFARFGFRVKVEDPVWEFERIDFCQTRPIFLSPGEPIMCRYPMQSMSKDVASFLNIERSEGWKYMLRAIGACGSSSFSQVPVLGEFYSALSSTSNKDETKWWKRTGVDLGFKQLTNNVGTIPYDEVTARSSFYKAFGILPDTQAALESKIRNWNMSSVPHIEQVHKFSSEFPVVDGWA